MVIAIKYWFGGQALIVDNITSVMTKGVSSAVKLLEVEILLNVCLPDERLSERERWTGVAYPPAGSPWGP